MASIERLAADDWVDAAYARFADAGLGAVRVELVARDLGATKGSFYWHFANRAELVHAVMARWEQEETEQIIETVQSSVDARLRLTALFTAVSSRRAVRGGEATLYVDAEREGVQEIVARVSERRVDYVADILVELGIDRGEAERRGAIALAVVLGLQHLALGSGRALVADARMITTTALAMMTAPIAT